MSILKNCVEFTLQKIYRCLRGALLLGGLAGVVHAQSLELATAAVATSTSLESGVADVPAPGSLPDSPGAGMQPERVTLRGTPLRFLKDQGVIWSSPARIRGRDLVWLAPFAAATGVAIATDHRTLTDVVSHNPSFNQTSVNASNVLTGGLLAAPAALYGLGLWKHDEHARETGLLSAEAVLDGLVVEQGVKLIFWRERPTTDNERGLFFKGSAGVDSSFPSSHSMLTWAAAAVMAEEYPSKWKQVGIYTLATGVSLTRVMGQEHFPSDVLVGSAAGWLIGHYVFRAHHRHWEKLP